MSACYLADDLCDHPLSPLLRIQWLAGSAFIKWYRHVFWFDKYVFLDLDSWISDWGKEAIARDEKFGCMGTQWIGTSRSVWSKCSANTFSPWLAYNPSVIRIPARFRRLGLDQLDHVILYPRRICSMTYWRKLRSRITNHFRWVIWSPQHYLLGM